MSNVILLVFASSCVLIVSGSGSDLPPFIPKCSLSDPKFQECFREKANQVIPTIAKGVPDFGIPPVSPAQHPKTELKLKDLTIALEETYQDDLKNLKIIDSLFDLKNKNVRFTATLDKLGSTAKSYTITDGKMLGVPVNGHGRFNLTLEDFKLEYKAELHTYQKDNDTYVEFRNPVVDTSSRGHFYFENIQSPKKNDVNAYINENEKKFMAEQMKPVVDQFLKTYIGFSVDAISARVPIAKMFLP